VRKADPYFIGQLIITDNAVQRFHREIIRPGGYEIVPVELQQVLLPVSPSMNWNMIDTGILDHRRERRFGVLHDEFCIQVLGPKLLHFGSRHTHASCSPRFPQPILKVAIHRSCLG
jgi:hypothetical protein